MESICPVRYLLHRSAPPGAATKGGVCPPAGSILPDPHAALRSNEAMLDVIYLLIGAAFLGACVLYAIACDHL